MHCNDTAAAGTISNVISLDALLGQDSKPIPTLQRVDAVFVHIKVLKSLPLIY